MKELLFAAVLAGAGALAAAAGAADPPAPERSPGFAEAGRSPYAGWEGREIKALSAEQVEDLLAGRGLSLALAAELNRYPGPTHVLDLAEALGLSEAQAGEMRALKARMQGEARALGRAIVEKEATLDRLFAGGAAEDGALGTLVFAIARLEGELRHTHLRYHLLARALLSPEQVAEYVRLRGYAGAPAGGDSSHRHGTMGAHN